jgi:hypothetical protein
MATQLVTAVTSANHRPSASGGLLRQTWRRIRMAIDEMNYATERVMDVRAPR